MLKQHPLQLIIFYHTFTGLILTTAYIGIDAAVAGAWRMTEYTTKQWLICIAASAADVIALNTDTLAYQKDSSGFVALISYVNIVYGYACD